MNSGKTSVNTSINMAGIPAEIEWDPFTLVLQQMQETHDRKQQDYGAKGDEYANCRSAEDFGVPSWVGVAIRMQDKMKRIQNFAKKGVLMNESIEDAFLDLAVYSVIGLVLYREGKKA